MALVFPKMAHFTAETGDDNFNGGSGNVMLQTESVMTFFVAGQAMTFGALVTDRRLK